MNQAVEIYIGEDTNNRRFRVDAETAIQAMDLLKERGVNLDIYERIKTHRENEFLIVDCIK